MPEKPPTNQFEIDEQSLKRIVEKFLADKTSGAFRPKSFHFIRNVLIECIGKEKFDAMFDKDTHKLIDPDRFQFYAGKISRAVDEANVVAVPQSQRPPLEVRRAAAQQKRDLEELYDTELEELDSATIEKLREMGYEI